MLDADIQRAVGEVLKTSDLTRYFNYTGPSDTTVPVAEVQARVRALLGEIDDLEAKVDAAVVARGGEKLEMIDLGEKVKNLGRRLMGSEPEPDEEMYHFPA